MDINNGIAHLKNSDPLIEKVIDEYPVPTLKTAKDLFESLIKYIVYQQLSTSSAAAIYGRLEKYFSSSKITPKYVSLSSSVELKSLGLSKQKIGYIFSLSDAWPKLKNKLRNIDKLSDDQIGNELMQLKGVGPWTVDMFLIFSLGRPDVLPVGDLVVQKGYAKLHNMNRLPSKSEMINGAEKWRPYRTLASLYLWDIIDGPFEW